MPFELTHDFEVVRKAIVADVDKVNKYMFLQAVPGAIWPEIEQHSLQDSVYLVNFEQLTRGDLGHCPDPAVPPEVKYSKGQENSGGCARFVRNLHYPKYLKIIDYSEGNRSVYKDYYRSQLIPYQFNKDEILKSRENGRRCAVWVCYGAESSYSAEDTEDCSD